MNHLLLHVQNVAAGNGALLHEFVDVVELAETDNLEGCLDEAAGVEVEGFGGILEVIAVSTQVQ